FTAVCARHLVGYIVFVLCAVVAGRRALPSLPTRRSSDLGAFHQHVPNGLLIEGVGHRKPQGPVVLEGTGGPLEAQVAQVETGDLDRKSTRLNSSHVKISYPVFCLKKKK